MDEELPDYTMCLALPTFPEELPPELAARIRAAIEAVQAQLREQREAEPSR